MDGSPVAAGPEDFQAKNLQTKAPEGGATASPHDKGQTPELDLDRLVWDPEYRKAMRHLIKRGT